MKKVPDHIHFTEHPAERLAQLTNESKPDKIAFLVDENTKRHCLPVFDTSNCLIIEIKSGEHHKNIDTCQHIWKKLTDASFTRKSLLINLGGGVIGDMGGFTASTYKRGISFFNIPTTLLSQVDASIGGKLGVDFGLLKNHIGLFREPNAIIISSHFLKTLPGREVKSGFSEILKHGLIRDQKYWEMLKNLDIDQLEDFADITKRSVEIKNEVVIQDPTEKGLRKILNFGHTVGHAIETWNIQNGNSITHGEAIIAGMIIECKLSQLVSLLEENQMSTIGLALKEKYAKVEIPHPDVLIELMLHDKKNTSGNISFSLLKRAGECIYDIGAGKTYIYKAIDYYRDLYK